MHESMHDKSVHAGMHEDWDKIVRREEGSGCGVT
ncbi:hypothetical protein FDG2_0575 [Candidatus Protofrankia californiensis]|uniref:Uncharacterized protein n=1 Tax=Candidatus Protofrankia californiensis TaxID=1839754 RepID=A0A1C3NTW6_9ACTN|nr:hypothetical protein FDG2_0575 [Candidatus Protofrankia californiensis]